jgi:hypothetical protein
VSFFLETPLFFCFRLKNIVVEKGRGREGDRKEKGRDKEGQRKRKGRGREWVRKGKKEEKKEKGKCKE